MTALTLDPGILTGWIGRQERSTDVLDPRPARLMQVLLDHPATLGPGDELPPLWHWLYFPPETPTGDLGSDGHPQLGGFLPPIALPRRMWAGGRFAFQGPLRIGDKVDKTSEITAVQLKDGRSGPLCFVTVRHDLSVRGKSCLTEYHDIVYRGLPDPDAPPRPPRAAPRAADTAEAFVPSMPILFRYSALTFNSHRIHYDLDHCRQTEGYPGCIVHGPLIATLLAGLAERHFGKALGVFSFRAENPAFHTDRLYLNAQAGDPSAFWAARGDGALIMQAEAGAMG